MKKILIIVRSTIHYSHCSSIIDEIKKDNNLIKLVFMNDNKENDFNVIHSYRVKNYESGEKVLIQKDKTTNKEEVLLKENKNLKIIKGVGRKDKWIWLLQKLRETLTFISFIRREDNSAFFENQKRYVPSLILNINKILLLRKLLCSKITFNILKKIHNLIPSSRNIKSFLQEINPDLVLVIGGNWPSSADKFSSEIDYIKASKQKNIPSVIQVVSWDNLTARGLYHYEPDIMLAWNKDHYKEAVKIHGISKNKVKIIGSPFMDKWFNKEKNIASKKEFFKSINLDQNKPLVTYLGSSKNITTKESKIAEKIHLHLEKMGIQLIIRPHSANSYQFKNISKNIPVIPKLGNLPDTVESKKLMIATLKYSVATIGVNTTAMIDSIILQTPSIAITKNGLANGQKMTTHFEKIFQQGIFISKDTEESCAKEIQNIINNGINKKSKNKMELFIKEFCRPLGENISAGSQSLFEIKKLLN